MIAVGIPTYNEADNISELAQMIDSTAVSISEEIIIINSDGGSSDNTANIFQKTKTQNQKVSLTATLRGKGYNVKNIVDYVASNKEISYCMLVDGDVNSFNIDWLKKHINASKSGADYVVPNYSRYIQEGNTTNHFIYPLLSHLTSGKAPYQGIAGDFGLSYKFIQYLQELNWSDASLKYGVDIFMTINALFGGMKVREITLGNKLHKPSFDKMVRMFQEVAESYYAARKQISVNPPIDFRRDTNIQPSLLAGIPIDSARLNDRLSEALELFKKNKTAGLIIVEEPKSNLLDAEQWSHILAMHERELNNYAPKQLAESLTPFYLTRVVTYLRSISSTHEAKLEISKTVESLNKELAA